MEMRFGDEETLTLFLDDLDIKFNHIAPPGKTFPLQCLAVIHGLEAEGRLLAFLESVVRRHPHPGFKLFASELLNLHSIPTNPVRAAPGPAKPHVVSKRVVLNRHDLWNRVVLQARTAGDRIVAVTGGVGKTYSRWLISHMCDPLRKAATLATVELDSDCNIDAARLARLISTRLFAQAITTDGLAQRAREAKNIGAEIVHRFSELKERTWLFIDGITPVNLDKSAVDLLRTICVALDTGQCPNLWLFLVGLDPNQLGPDIAPYLHIDRVTRPRREDIENYLLWFADAIGRPHPAHRLKATVDEIDALLPSEPDHSSWHVFHLNLTNKCKGIEEGTLP